MDSQVIIAMRIEDQWLALEAAMVAEVLGPRVWMPMRGSHPGLVGAMAWRGSAVAVLDLARLTGRGRPLADGAGRPRTPVLRHAGLTLAVPVDQVREAIEVQNDRVQPSTGPGLERGWVEIEGIGMPILDARAVLDELLGRAEAIR